MKPSYPNIIRTGSTVTIEARTMAEADAAAEQELGPGFTVTSVRRLRKGGLGGFFALELVELVATTDPAPPAGTGPDMATAEDLIRSLQRHEGDFATRLLDRMGDVDPDAVTMQQLFSTARAAGVPTEGLWEDAIGAPARPAPRQEPAAEAGRDVAARLATVADAPGYTGATAPTTNELPVVADAIGPDPLPTDGPPLLRRRSRTPEPSGPLGEMPPPPLRFDDESGGWTVADDRPSGPDPDVEAASPPPTAPAHADTVAVPMAPPAPPMVPAAPTADAPTADAPAHALSSPPPPPPVAAPLPPPPPASAWQAPATLPDATAATATVAPPTSIPATDTEASPPTAAPADGPTLAELGWRIDVDTPEPVMGAVDLGPEHPAVDLLAAGPEARTPVAVAALDALPEVWGPVVNAQPEPVSPVARPGAVLPARRPDVTIADWPEREPSDAPESSMPESVEPLPLDPAGDHEPTEADPGPRADTDPQPDAGADPLADGDVDVDPFAEPSHSFGTERPRTFRPMGLESLRGPRRSSLSWRPRAGDPDGAPAGETTSTTDLPGTVPAFGAPSMRTAPAPDPVEVVEAVEAAPSAAPVEAAPDEVEPVTIEPVNVEPVNVEPVNVEPIAIEPVAIEPVAGPVEVEPVAVGEEPDETAATGPAPAPVSERVTPEPTPASAPPTAPAPAPVLTLGSLVPDAAVTPVDAPSCSGWSPQALFALGLPDRLVHTAAALAPRDDAEWTAALLLALRPLFGTQPTGPLLLAGPLVDVVAEQLGAEIVEPGERSCAPLAALVTDDPAEVTATLHGRGLHLVVGGMWHELARLRPSVVSTAGPRFLLPAVTVAHAWGVPLGVMAGVTTVRLDAVMVAMEIRATLGLDLEDAPSPARRLFTAP